MSLVGPCWSAPRVASVALHAEDEAQLAPRVERLGLAELGAQPGDRPAASRRGERVETHVQFVSDHLEVAGGLESLCEQAVRLVLCTGVVTTECTGKGGLDIPGRHADRVVDRLALVVEPARIGTDLTEADLGRDEAVGGLPLANTSDGLLVGGTDPSRAGVASSEREPTLDLLCRSSHGVGSLCGRARGSGWELESLTGVLVATMRDPSRGAPAPG